jgi:hypothetical protein
MSDSFRKRSLIFFKYDKTLDTIDSKVSDEEKNSYEIIKWEVTVGKELLNEPLI